MLNDSYMDLDTTPDKYGCVSRVIVAPIHIIGMYSNCVRETKAKQTMMNSHV